MFEQAATLERLARQHLILEDSALLDDYAHVREDFRFAARELASLPLDSSQIAALYDLADQEYRLYQNLSSPQRTPDITAQIVNGYAKLVDGTREATTATNQLTQHAIERLQETASRGREKWLYLGLATVVIAIALAIVFAVLIARPIRQLDQAIRQMGTADFTHAIRVTGPQDLRYVGQRLEWLRARLSELEQQQTRFLRHVSHELKTPLTAVREGVELLRDNVAGKLTVEQQEIVRIVRENTLSLQKLIEDLLSYHQTRSMEPQTLGPVALVDVLRRVVREHKLAAFARMVTFEARLTPAIVVGDADKIRAIIDNLLSNAIKYSPRAGSIELRVGADGPNAVLDVIDEGPGVAADHRDRIFDSFYQGPAPAEGYVKGSGLGLAIAREYAIVHGGGIELLQRSDGKRGAWFRLWLPSPAATAYSAKSAVTKAVTLAGIK